MTIQRFQCTEEKIKDIPFIAYLDAMGTLWVSKHPKNIWQIDLLSYCSNIQPKLNKLQKKPTEAIKND